MRRRTAIAGAAAAAAALAAIVAARAGAGGDREVPTTRAVRSHFIRTITAEGTLRAVKATPITTAMDPEGPFKIAWVIADGSRVAAGDAIARFDPTDMEKELADGLADRGVAAEKTAKASSTARDDAPQPRPRRRSRPVRSSSGRAPSRPPTPRSSPASRS